MGDSSELPVGVFFNYKSFHFKQDGNAISMQWVSKSETEKEDCEYGRLAMNGNQ